MKFDFDKQSVKVAIPGDQSLTYVAYAIQTAIEWFVTHGIVRFSLVRNSDIVGTTLYFRALDDQHAKLMQFSKIALIGDLINEGYFPMRLTRVWGEESGLGEVSFNLEKIVTVLSLAQLNPEIPISHYAFGLAEEIIRLFVLGAHQIKHQTAIQAGQTWSNVNVELNKKKLKDWLDSQISFDVNELTNSLSVTT